MNRKCSFSLSSGGLIITVLEIADGVIGLLLCIWIQNHFISTALPLPRGSKNGTSMGYMPISNTSYRYDDWDVDYTFLSEHLITPIWVISALFSIQLIFLPIIGWGIRTKAMSLIACWIWSKSVLTFIKVGMLSILSFSIFTTTRMQITVITLSYYMFVFGQFVLYVTVIYDMDKIFKSERNHNYSTEAYQNSIYLQMQASLSELPSYAEITQSDEDELPNYEQAMQIV